MKQVHCGSEIIWELSFVYYLMNLQLMSGGAVFPTLSTRFLIRTRKKMGVKYITTEFVILLETLKMWLQAGVEIFGFVVLIVCKIQI